MVLNGGEVKSVGYALRSISQSYRLPANHIKLFQCKFRQLSHTLLVLQRRFLNLVSFWPETA